MTLNILTSCDIADCESVPIRTASEAVLGACVGARVRARLTRYEHQVSRRFDVQRQVEQPR